MSFQVGLTLKPSLQLTNRLHEYQKRFLSSKFHSFSVSSPMKITVYLHGDHLEMMVDEKTTIAKLKRLLIGQYNVENHDKKHLQLEMSKAKDYLLEGYEEFSGNKTLKKMDVSEGTVLHMKKFIYRAERVGTPSSSAF